MKKRNSYKRIASLGMTVVCMAVVMIFTSLQVKASDEVKTVKYEPNYVYSQEEYVDSKTQEKIAPTLDGYLFAGWYTSDGTTYEAVSLPEEGATYYAKFVPSEVLDVKAQVSSTLTDDDTSNDKKADLRFVTTIDSIYYNEVGFTYKITVGNRTITSGTLQSNKVYRQLYAVGSDSTEVMSYVPEKEFCSESKYFKAITVSRIPSYAFDGEITAQPFWITPDGTKVVGTRAIKSVNLGRSWVYVDSSANSDSMEYGTHRHPYTNLNSALNAVLLQEGKIIVKADKELKVPADFKWVSNKVDGNVRNVTVTGENGTGAFLNFDVVPDMGINDNVTFENIKLQFATQVYANGNRLEIAENVELANTDTNLYGGASKAAVESTHLEIHAGTWAGIYGGGRYSGGNVSKDTNINITNAKIFSATKDSTMIIGGGRGANTVGGNTNITVGAGFNADVTIEDGHYSAIYGGGKDSGSVVIGNTNVIIKDGAKVNFVYGGGASNTVVKGTCNVTLNDGEVYSIWGGARGEDPSAAGKNEKDTVVKVTGGTVAQIIGGNGTGMTGNTYVEVSGGKVTRRIYGGCYHGSAENAGYVNGISTVVIGENATLDFSLFLDGLCTGSRYAGSHDDEVGILIFNGGTYDSHKNKIGGANAQTYDYLVKATKGGDVTVAMDILENEPVLSVKSNAETPGTVTDASEENVAYFKGDAVCLLPSREDLSAQCVVNVVFNDTNAEAELSKCEARIDGMHYSQFQEAVGVAKIRKDKPTVTLLKDATVSTVLDITQGTELTIMSEGNPKTITSALTGDGETLFSTHGKLTLENLNITGGHHTFRNFAGSDVKAENVSITNIEGAAIYQSNGTFTGTGLNIDTVVKHGIFIEGGTVNLDDVTISNIVGDASSRDGIHCAGGTLNITADNEQKNGVTISDVHSRNGIFLNGGKFKADQVKIQNVKLNGIYVDNSSKPEISNLTIDGAEGEGILLEDTSQSKFTTVLVKNTKLQGIYMRDSAEAMISNATVQDIIKQGVFLQDDAKATITGITVSNTNNQGVFLQYNAQATISDFVIRGKGDTALRCKNGSSVTATNGTIYAGTATTGSLYGIYIDGDETGASNVSLTNVKIERASSNDQALVVIKSGATLTMNEQDGGTSSIDGKKGTYTGRGVEVEGTFNLNGGTICNNDLTSGDGAGVLVSAGGTLNMTGGTLSNNFAANAGGAVAVKGSSNFTLDGTGSIINNIAINDGAGVYLYDGATFTVNSGTITGNNFGDKSGSGRGGAVSIAANGKTTKFELNGGTISDNVGRAGGAVIIRNANCEFKMTGGEIKNNSVTTFDLDVTSPTKKGQGGAVWMGNGSFVMEGGKISSNKAETKYGSGGAVYVNGGTCTLQGGDITDNTAAFNSGNNGGGGGVLVAGGTCTIKGTANVSANKATTQEGGGVCVTGGTFSLQGGTISSNEAKAGGGGLSVNGSGATVTISGGAISNNIAQYGAGMMVRACKAIYMTSGTISGNEASKQGGGIYLKPVTFTMTGGSITDNKTNDGGAIFVSKGSGTSSAATINYGGGIISGNYSSNAAKAGIYCDTTTTANQGIINYTTSDATIADVITNMIVNSYTAN